MAKSEQKVSNSGLGLSGGLVDVPFFAKERENIVAQQWEEVDEIFCVLI